MSDNMRWRHGDTNPIMAAVDSAQVIEIGDLLFLNTDDARPASQQTDQETEDLNQQLFALNFLGVAMQRSRNGDTALIRVATTGSSCLNFFFTTGDMVTLCATLMPPSGSLSVAVRNAAVAMDVSAGAVYMNVAVP